MHTVPAFKLQEYSDGGVESLWLVFEPKLMEFRNRPSKYLRATKCLVEQFFVIEQENLFGDSDEIVIQDEAAIPVVEPSANENPNGLMEFENFDDDDDSASDDSDELPVKIIDDLYQQLREGHRDTGPVQNYTDEYIQHAHLRPTLTHYQVDGVKWMLNRERIVDYFPTEFKEVIPRWPDLNATATKFFYNERTIVLLADKNDDVAIPTGGILADAMGLGKTVEMLDLILLNPRSPIELAHGKQFIDLTQYEFEDDPDFLRCLCAKKTVVDTVRCTRCYHIQHRSCVSQRDKLEAPDTQYICPTCWQKEEPLKAKTTFIVSPPSIKLQWRDEVIKHISDANFKVSISLSLSLFF